MKLSLNNTTNLNVIVRLDQFEYKVASHQCIVYDLCTFNSPFVLRFFIASNTNFDKTDGIYLNVSSTVSCTMVGQDYASIIIDQRIKNYQNYTHYRYLTFVAEGMTLTILKHNVELHEGNTKNIMQQKRKKTVVSYLIKKSVVDAIIDGIIIALIVAWVLSVWMGLMVFVAVFIIALVVNSIMLRLSRSKKQWLNWNRDFELDDDVEYLIENIDKYCD